MFNVIIIGKCIRITDLRTRVTECVYLPGPIERFLGKTMKQKIDEAKERLNKIYQDTEELRELI